MPSPNPTDRLAARSDQPSHGSLDPQRHTALTAFYHDHHRRLTVRLRCRVPGIQRFDLDDACGFAWAQLARRRDIQLDRRGFAWLTTVAVREALRLTNAPELDERPDPSNAASDPLERALATETHRQRQQRFSQLTPAQRRDLLLAAAGYSYREIAAITDSTYTAVNRHITEGRARLRNE